jgi:hypothetical protein
MSIYTLKEEEKRAEDVPCAMLVKLLERLPRINNHTKKWYKCGRE